MKIDLLIDSLNGGGAEKVMTTLAKGFVLKNHKVHLITFNDGSAFELDSKVNRIQLHSGKLKNHTLRSLINLYKYYKKATNRPDVLISFMPANNFIAITISKFFGLKVIVSEHNNHISNVSFKSKWIRKLLYRYADATTVLTKFDEPFFERLGANTIVMPNPIYLPQTIKPFKERNKNILAAGSLRRYKVKGFDVLIQISAPILQQHVDWTLTIAGSGKNEMILLKNLTKRLNIEKQVIFTGFCSNMEQLMQSSQIFVLSSQFEGLPMVLMEALSNGMACIAYDCISGPGDLIEHNNNGVLIENQNIDALRDGLFELIQNTKIREKIAENAALSVSQYSLNNIVQKWENLITNVTKS